MGLHVFYHVSKLPSMHYKSSIPCTYLTWAISGELSIIWCHRVYMGQQCDVEGFTKFNLDQETRK
mgnify:CR=1 FL=1